MGLLAARSLSPTFPNTNNAANNYSTNAIPGAIPGVPILHTKYSRPSTWNTNVGGLGGSAENPLLLSAIGDDESPLPVDGTGDNSGDGGGDGSVVKSDEVTVVVGGVNGGGDTEDVRRGKMTAEERRVYFTKVSRFLFVCVFLLFSIFVLIVECATYDINYNLTL